MTSKQRLNGWLTVVVAVATAWQVRATETENLDLRVLPAQKPIVVDGKFDDWDLSGGVFTCGDVELQRDLGMTFSDGTGTDTAVRTFWSNQQTGLVSDEVFELKINPANWGDLQFE